MLSEEQVTAFRRDGVLVAGDAVDAKQLAGLRAVLAGWVEESRSHDAPFGESAPVAGLALRQGCWRTVDDMVLR